MNQKLCSKVKWCFSVSGSAHSVGLILRKHLSSHNGKQIDFAMATSSLEVSTYLPTRNMQRPVSRKATRTPIHMSVEKGDSRLKVLSSEIRSLRRIKPRPVCMKGVLISTKCSLIEVMVSGATAKSAS